MILTFEQIKSFAQGALFVEKIGDRIRLRRMTETMEKAFVAMSSGHANEVCCSTDCRLDFHTDSRHLRVDFAVDFIRTNTHAKYEIFVNDVPYLFLRETGNQHTLCLDLPQGDKHVTICLPSHNVGYFRNVFLDEGSYARPHVFDKKILFIGDSITQGYTATHDAQSYSYLVARYFNASSLNWGVGGAKFYVSTLESTDFDPDIVSVAYGTNDYEDYTKETFERNCNAFLDKLKELYGNKQVFVITPIWRADGEVVRASGTHAQCCQCIAKAAAERGFTVVDGYQIFPHTTEYFQDGLLHPNDLGFHEYARNLIRAFQPYM